VEKLAIIVPYRNRYDQLEKFTEYITRYLDNRKFKYYIIVVEQDDAKEFNRGKLLNIGYTEAKKKACDYLVFHDVDMLPIDVDYSYVNRPTHLISEDLPFPEYFGGVTLFPIEDFEKINGFSNNYWGWGFEDDDIRYRCMLENVGLRTFSLQNKFVTSRGLKLNGENAYVSTRNLLKSNRDFSFFIEFYPHEVMYDTEKDFDKYSLLSIPGFDFSINYTSFNRFQVEFFNEDRKYYQVYSDVINLINSRVGIGVTYIRKDKKLLFYINGKKIGDTIHEGEIYPYHKERVIYLGCSKAKEHFLPTTYTTFAYYDCALTKEDFASINNNREISLLENFENYNNCGNLKTYFDFKYLKEYKAIDLSGNGNEGEIEKGEPINISKLTVNKHGIPYRKTGRVKKLPHINNGFYEGKWKHQSTRWNQIRFNNEVEKGYYNTKLDGLSNLQFKTHSKKQRGKVITLNVGI